MQDSGYTIDTVDAEFERIAGEREGDMSAKMKRMLGAVAAGLSVWAAVCVGTEDYWTPRGAPQTDEWKMKTLEQVEPRVNISQLPFDITNAGSCYVTAPLNGAPSSNGITIKASHVRLDLCGFALNGTGGTNGECGIATPEPCDNISIRNGSFSTVIGCKARNNGGAGIHTYSHSRVSECTATESAKAESIHVEDCCSIRESTAAKNLGHGIRVANRRRVVANTCGENGFMKPGTNAAGIYVDGSNNIIDGNNVMGNDIGILIESNKIGNLVIRNMSGRNTPDFDYYPTPPPPGNFVGPIDTLMESVTNMNPWANFQM
ncbi:MAG: right-handed parallel beta-helix repeat-containing protein [Verrucomicrobiota bacterium]|nr:right-handed parallel beta-helix repeat-containing protein [Verrucomicrobiota bacterium]